MTQLERSPQPLERGRTLLAMGATLRRAKKRREARAALTQALEIFDLLGTPLWAERAAQELARIPGRTAASTDLTETERRVAELVAQGLSNKEVAAAPVRLGAHGRGEPVEHLRQARPSFAQRAGRTHSQR